MQKMHETSVQALGWEDPLEEETATQSSILAWGIPWAEEPSKLQSTESQGVEQKWATEHTSNNYHFFLCWEHLWSTVLATIYKVLVAKSCPALWDPMDYSLPGSSTHGISQARILEQVAISFSRGSSQLRDQTHVSKNWQADSLPLSHQGSLICEFSFLDFTYMWYNIVLSFPSWLFT